MAPSVLEKEEYEPIYDTTDNLMDFLTRNLDDLYVAIGQHFIERLDNDQLSEIVGDWVIEHFTDRQLKDLLIEMIDDYSLYDEYQEYANRYHDEEYPL